MVKVLYQILLAAFTIFVDDIKMISFCVATIVNYTYLYFLPCIYHFFTSPLFNILLKTILKTYIYIYIIYIYSTSTIYHLYYIYLSFTTPHQQNHQNTPRDQMLRLCILTNHQKSSKNFKNYIDNYFFI